VDDSSVASETDAAVDAGDASSSAGPVAVVEDAVSSGTVVVVETVGSPVEVGAGVVVVAELAPAVVVAAS
jgi:hypothetical protein